MPWAESIRANTSDAVPKGNGGNKKMDADVDMLSFTGSTGVGKAAVAKSAATLKKYQWN